MTTGNYVREHLKSTFTDDGELVEEYCREFEHQDGLGCWAQFGNFGEIETDFQLYKESK